MLNIEKEILDGKVTFTLEGRLDTNTSMDLEDEVRACVEDTKEIVFDFEKLDYISSAGLRVLLLAQKAMNKQEDGSMKVLNVNSSILEIFEVTGFSDILTLE